MSKVFSKATAALSIVLVLCLMALMLPAGIAIQSVSAASVWDGKSIEQPTAGTGYSDNPYWIQNAAQLAWLAINYNSTEGIYQSWQQAYYILKSDIDLGNHEWTPIGTKSIAFKGHFDGNNYKITGLKVNSTEGNAGLFGKVNVGYQTKNFKNIHVEGSVTSTANTVGGIIGNSVGGTTNLTNCTFTGSVNGATNVGGLVGYASGSLNLTNCSSSATVTGAGSVGGLVGQLWDHSTPSTATTLLFEGCSSTGNVTGTDGVGGLVGNVSGYDATANRTVTVSNSFSAGTFKGTGRGGGLVGQTQAYNAATTIALNIRNSYSAADLSGVPIVGALAGVIYPSLKDDSGFTTANISLSVDNCHFAGKASGYAILYGITGGNCAKIVDANFTASKVRYITSSGIYNNNGSRAYQRSVGAFADGTVATELGSGWGTSVNGYPVLTDIASGVYSALTAVGTSTRLGVPTGLQMHFSINKNIAPASYGVLVAKNSALGDDVLYKTTAYKQVDTDLTGKDFTDFTAVLYNISEANYATNYTARAYATYTDSKNQEVIVYSTAITDSIKSVAQKALDSGDPYTDSEKEILNGFVK